MDQARTRFTRAVSELPVRTEAQHELQRREFQLLVMDTNTLIQVLNQVRSDLPAPVALVVGFWLLTLFLAAPGRSAPSPSPSPSRGRRPPSACGAS